MSIYDEPKIDCHSHVFDPRRFPYASDSWYRPVDAETGTPDQLLEVFSAYGVQRAVIVGPNSGYGEDSSCLLDTLRRGDGRFKGMAVVANDIPRRELERLKGAGVLGITFNAALFGAEYYAKTADLLAELRDLEMYVDVQVEGDQAVTLAPLLAASGVRILIDHCGRPTPAAGLDQPGFAALVRLAETGRAYVKLSGYVKFSEQRYPYRDAWPYVQRLLDAFGVDGCVWGSDWPFLRAPERVDYGPLLTLLERFVPDPADRAKVLWATPNRLFGFDAPS